jgi:flavin reductase (DIM6/NTAB) family NADH-FMN oxidoreductase RutF
MATDFLNMKKPVSLAHASRLINHGPTVLVSTLHEGRRNLMAAAWSMPVEFDPPRLAIVIDKSTLTREHVSATGCLALSVPGRSLADATFAVGSISGRDLPHDSDKFAQYGLTSFASPELGLPWVEDAVAWLECRVIREPHTEQAYDTFFVEVISAQADERVFANGRWRFNEGNADMHTLHHLGAGSFVVASDTVQAQKL